MLTTIIASSTDTTSKGALKPTHHSISRARQVNWRLMSAGVQLLDVPEGVGEGGGDSDGATCYSSKSNLSKSEDGSNESGVIIMVGLANSADSALRSSSRVSSAG